MTATEAAPRLGIDPVRWPDVAEAGYLDVDQITIAKPAACA